MARKKASAARNANGDADPKSDAADAAASMKATTDIDSQGAAPSSTPRLMPIKDVTKINNYNLTELKNTCDDTLKKLLSQLFQQQHTHADIRLTLGYLSIIIAAATALYGWKRDFEQSKPIVQVGVALYFILTGLQTLYVYFVERNTVFVGKRKTFALRIETERLTVSSKTIPSTETSPPQYALELNYLHSANGGKALLKRGKDSAQQGYNVFFDADGNMMADVFATWVEGLVVKATDS